MEMWSEKHRWGRGTALCTSCLLAYTRSRLFIPPGCQGDALVKARQNVRQFSLVKVYCYHEKSLRVLGLELTDMFM